jgi:ElaA protein
VITTEWRLWTEMPVAQAYELLRFRQAVFVVEQRSPYPDLDGRDAEAWHLLLRRDGELAGYLRLLAPPPALRIGRVCVTAPQRGRGLGRRLVGAALACARRHHPGCAIGLSAQTPLVPFYRKFGFEPVGAPYDDFGVAHLDMMLRPG